MSDTAASPPAGTPPVDRRPRPQYGELAPEGWVWNPPTDAAAPTAADGTAAAAAAPDVVAPGKRGKIVKASQRPKSTTATPTAALTPPRTTSAPAVARPSPKAQASPKAQPLTTAPPLNSLIRPVPAWDRYVTITLLGIGLLATFYAVFSLSEMPTAMQRLYTLQDLGTYAPGASVSVTLLVGSMLQGLVWAATAALSVSLMVRGKRTLYLPIVGAVVSGVVLFGFMVVLLLTDPTLVSFFGRP